MTEQNTHGSTKTLPPATDVLFLTIAVPTLNRLAYLRETLESVFDQTCDDFEIIVSNNCSCDGTKEYLDQLNQLRIALYHQESTLSMIANWNFLLERAKGTFFLLLSDDDLIGRDFVKFCKNEYTVLHDKSDRVTVIYGSTGIINSQGTLQEYWKNDELDTVEPGEDLIINWFKGLRPVSFCSTLFRTTPFKKIGGFDEKNRYAADVVARSRLSANNFVVYAREAIAYYRVHETNATNQSFTEADRLEYNLDITRQSLKALENGQKRIDIAKAGEKYAKRVFITESAVGCVRDFRLRKTFDFVATYLRHFTIADLFFLDLAHYFRRVLKEVYVKILKPTAVSTNNVNRVFISR